MLDNPILNLINVPIQNNWEFGIGPATILEKVWALPTLFSKFVKVNTKQIK